MAEKKNLRMKFKLHGLEFELEGNEETVKEEFQNFKSFITGDLLPNVNITQPQIIQPQNPTNQITGIPTEATTIDMDDYPALKEVVMKDLPNSETDWILVYAFYSTDYGQKTFTLQDIKDGYESTKRSNTSRLNNLSNNLKSLAKKGYIKVHNDTDYLLKQDGIDYSAKILNGESTSKSSSRTSGSKSSSKEKGTSSKQSKATSFKLDRNLNLRPDGKVSLSDFSQKYNCDSTPKRILMIVFYLKEILQLENVNPDHIYTAFEKLNIRVPKSLYQLISDTKNKFGWLDFETTDDINLSIQGKNAIKYDLPIKE